MGSYLSCVSCIQRDQEAQLNSEKPTAEASLDSSTCGAHSDSSQQCKTSENDLQTQMKSAADAPKEASEKLPTTPSSTNALQQQINAIVSARKDTSKQPTPAQKSNDELQQQINAIVSTRAQPSKQVTAACSSDGELKGLINSIVGAHAESLKQQRLASAVDQASPSPAKSSLSDDDLSYIANLALSAAKQRSTPAKSPAPSWEQWASWEDDHFTPCQLNFEYTESNFDATMNVSSNSSWCSPELELAPSAENFYGSLDYDHAQGQATGDWCNPINYADASYIAAPCADHSFSESNLEATMYEPTCSSPLVSAPAPESFYGVAENNIQHEGQFAGCRRPPSLIVHDTAGAFCGAAQCGEKAEATACPLAMKLKDIPSPTRNRAKRLSWAAMTDAEDEQRLVANHGNETLEPAEKDREFEKIDDAARVKELEVARLQTEEKAARAAMDKVCVETFLEAVKKVAWRERIRTPIKGTNLYTKHIRPSRPRGTSVDVKDSSFRYLGVFLEFLESEGLLRLQPGLTDPVVTDIYFDACRKYKYSARESPACF